VAEPGNQRRLEALRLEIEELAEKDAEFRKELAGLLKGMAGDVVSVAATQTATQNGDGNTVVQGAGYDVSVQIK
jgi:hypothetical protein